MSGIRGNYCQFCDKRVIDCNCHVPSPAHSDKDAEREACAQICDRLESMMVQGGGETRPGERLAQAARLIRERAAQPFPPERKRLWEQHNDEGEIGWYFDCDGHYIDVERDVDGKYSVYFRNRADESKAWLDQAEVAAQESAPSSDLWESLHTAEAALADIGDADREPGDDVAWCERRAAKALPQVRAALARRATAGTTAAPTCPTCGGSSVDPGGLPACRTCMAERATAGNAAPTGEKHE